MSWRVVVAIMVTVFVLLGAWAMTAGPLHTVTNSIDDASDGDADVQDQIDEGMRGYFNMIMIIVGGTFVWGAWRVLRRELTRGRL